ncbi:MAG: TatD family hydrolase [Candidatus Marinimicrobia bacterium]|nr:TatD family hydrolase [Candidatus Neomarinimicrobiota bacterium]MCF7830124.1 TatD family hydrolase [Candidatus Neomarinimicrobiota bacterium]MCF7882201.1 TatD family hydrolase [Candidatus Neomarinimicrobiota bacterium]
MLIDTHAHIQFDTYDSNRDEIIQRAQDNGVEYIVCPGIDPDSNELAIQIAEQYDNVFATVGIHPHDSEDLPEKWLQTIEEQLEHPKVVALGEIGLDYFKEYTPKETQRRIFREQLELASSLDIPVVVHNRDSDEDMKSLMLNYGPKTGVMHCFTSDIDMAQALADTGYIISFSGIATFGNKTVTRTIRELDLSHMMVETDCPFLAPVPKRGKTNEPAFVRHTAEKVAELKSVDIDTVEKVTTENAIGLFSLPL